MHYYRNEAALIRDIVKRVTAQFPRAWVLKTHGAAYQRGGVPDLLIVVGGRMIAVEAKHRKPGESVEALRRRVTPRQEAELSALERAGATTLVAWTTEQVLRAIDAAIPSTGQSE